MKSTIKITVAILGGALLTACDNTVNIASGNTIASGNATSSFGGTSTVNPATTPPDVALIQQELAGQSVVPQSITTQSTATPATTTQSVNVDAAVAQHAQEVQNQLAVLTAEPPNLAPITVASITPAPTATPTHIEATAPPAVTLAKAVAKVAQQPVGTITEVRTISQYTKAAAASR